MSKLKYIIDKKYDGLMIYQMLKAQKNEAGIKYQADMMGIGFKFAQKVAKKTNYKDIQEEIAKIVDAKYQKYLNGLKKSRQAYQKSWNQINDRFFVRLEKITNFPIQHKVFECVVSAFHPGISNWGGNKIVRIWNLDPLKQRRITAHEIIISHFFSFIKKNFPKEKSNNKIWQLAEIFAFISTGLDEVMRQFWPWDKSGSYLNHNYPEIVDAQKKLTSVYIKKGFKEFVSRGLKLIK